MTIKQQGGIFGRNPTFNNVDVEGTLTVNGEPISDFGTMAQQDANNVNIDGGSIDGVTLGANAQILTDGFVDFYNNTGLTNTLRISAEGNNLGETNAIEFYRGALADHVVSKIALDRITDVNTGELRFYLSDAVGTLHQNMTMDGNGNVELDRGNLVIGTSGKGIDFSATSGTGTSELFDDYEEGTWTLSVTGQTATATGYYTKIGDTVNCWVEFTADTDDTNTNVMEFSGFPFTVNSNTSPVAGITVYDHDNSAGFNAPAISSSSAGVNLVLIPNTTKGALRPQVSLSGNTNLFPYYYTNLLKVGTLIRITATYKVA